MKPKDDGIDCSKDEVLTQQSSKDECDINLIIAKAKRGAEISHLNPRTPFYGDFTQIPKDLRECLMAVRKADEAFMSLDAVVRRRFDNDPVKLLDFLNDPANRKEAIELGLVSAPEKSVAVPEPVVEPAAPIADVSGPKKAKAKPVDE